jgi:hypothetical protein
MVEVVDNNSKWTDLVEGMTAYQPRELQAMLNEAGFVHTVVYRKRPSYATIIGIRK